MKWILDMVHHNPGEDPICTSFTNPKKLKDYGFNGQVFKHINCAAKFSTLNKDIVPTGSAQEIWTNKLIDSLHQQNYAAKALGLAVFYHIDLFVLPRRLVGIYYDSLCNREGLISLEKPFTLEIHQLLFEELVSEFPEIDGFIIRVGETYLYDTPYHVGNGPIRKAQYEGGSESDASEIIRYQNLIEFLRTELCIKKDKWVIFRTWDCYPDKFHANLSYYLSVTNKIEPHEKLVFSIKHTALDFWRRVQFNPCIAQGQHAQIIEVQCQREYEGKGAHPNYIMDGVIHGFPECKQPKGLRDVWCDKRIMGVYTWSRGGGWFGPYIKNELWCDLHAYIIAQFANTPQQGDAEIFERYTIQILKLPRIDVPILYNLCKLSAKAVLHGRYCEAYDISLSEQITPTNLWMRDDRLGGMEQLEPVFFYLEQHNLTEEALQEKYKCVQEWSQVCALAENLTDSNIKPYIIESAKYGLMLYSIVAASWRILLLSRQSLQSSCLVKALHDYDKAWEIYRRFYK
ncbi:MAG: hypothetical protein PHG02_02250, partial [Oscillospiraceae bacterium]|nr:hypothetical protein [Oscillospiraceae bacterium]